MLKTMLKVAKLFIAGLAIGYVLIPTVQEPSSIWLHLGGFVVMSAGVLIIGLVIVGICRCVERTRHVRQARRDREELEDSSVRLVRVDGRLDNRGYHVIDSTGESV